MADDASTPPVGGAGLPAGSSQPSSGALIATPSAGTPAAQAPLPSGPDPQLPAPQREAADGTVMSLVDHLTELRSRIFRALLAVGAGTIVGFLLADRIIALIAEPVGGRLLNLAPGDAFSIYIRVALVVGVILAMPVILYQVWAFIAPGLTPEERRIVRPWVPLALAFFAIGVIVAWVVLPFALAFLLGFGGGVFVNELAAAPYFNFVTTLFLAFGLVMEFPILLFGLSRVGILTSERLRAARRYVILGIAIFAAVVTPGGDLVSPFTLGGTMYLLYEGTLFVIRRTGR
jgi:sec-independent protein translocase protein TatC